MRIPAKQQEFIAARGRLRQILARYLDTHPSSLRFAYGAAGKPALAFPESSLAFNLAHAGCWGLLGLCAQGEIGVDVEWLQRPVDIGQIAGWAFGEATRAELEALPRELKALRFHQLWTAREAHLKALGTGFTLPAISASSLLQTGHLLLDVDYLGAWAISAEATVISCWDYPTENTE